MKAEFFTTRELQNETLRKYDQVHKRRLYHRDHNFFNAWSWHKRHGFPSSIANVARIRSRKGPRNYDFYRATFSCKLSVRQLTFNNKKVSPLEGKGPTFLYLYKRQAHTVHEHQKLRRFQSMLLLALGLKLKLVSGEPCLGNGLGNRTRFGSTLELVNQKS